MKLTLTELRESSDQYFRRHLAREEWKAFSEETKQSALTEAEADIALYLNCVEVDTDEPLASKALFEQVPSMTLPQIKAFQEKWVKDRKYVYVVLGDEKNLDMKGLSEYGPIQKLTQEELFGY